MITSINLSDNIYAGYSHFYLEVLRLHHAVKLACEKKHMLLIFDELFKGTNAEDAMDASLMFISEALKIDDSAFFISSHLLDLASNIPPANNLTLQCFKTLISPDAFEFDYKLTTGFSKDRIGLHIFSKSGIIDLLRKGQKMKKIM